MNDGIIPDFSRPQAPLPSGPEVERPLLLQLAASWSKSYRTSRTTGRHWKPNCTDSSKRS